jgi:hypothetical protein
VKPASTIIKVKPKKYYHTVHFTSFRELIMSDDMNPKLMKRLTRSPRSFDKNFYYFPSAMTANPEIPQGAQVKVLEKVDKAGTIPVRFGGKKYLVFLQDLCDN